MINMLDYMGETEMTGRMQDNCQITCYFVTSLASIKGRSVCASNDVNG